MKDYLLCYIAVANVLALFICLWDKKSAIKHGRRIPERTLFFIAIIGGSAGMYAGMLLFRHKTKHWQFMWGIPAILMFQLTLGILLFLPFR